MQADVVKRWVDRKGMDVRQGNVENYDNKVLGEYVERTEPKF